MSHELRTFGPVDVSQRACLAISLFVACATAFASNATALPRMSLTAGSPCATCHIAQQGGGVRNSIGFGTSQHTGAIPWSKIGINRFDKGAPTWLDDKISLGMDMRSVLARMGRPTGTKEKADLPSMIYVPMQLMPYLGLKPTDWLDVVGSVNVATVGPIGRSFPGQPSYEVAAQLHSNASMPTLRVGMIQPTFGIRHDDHSMLIRADASSPRRPFIAPNYADWGGELGYQPRAWFRIDAGGYLAQNLSKSVGSSVTDSDIAYSARVMLMPQMIFGGSGDGPPWKDGFDDDDDDDFGEDDEEEPADDAMSGSLNSWIGASILGAGDFRTVNAFLGVGASNIGSLMVEAAMVQKGGNFSALNMMAMASVRLGFEWLYFNVRGEMATAENTADVQKWETKQLVAGFEIFPLPYIEIRPEYRILRTDEYGMNHYTLQFHIAF